MEPDSASSFGDIRLEPDLDLEYGSHERTSTSSRLWKSMFLKPKRHVISHPFRSLADVIFCFTLAISIYVFTHTRKLEKENRRTQNDPYDNVSWYIHRNSPRLWNKDFQEFIHNAVPINVHSHNDYWRHLPLFEALGSGCIGVEADVHLRKSDLFVSHSALSIRSSETLRSLYLNPLQRMLEEQNANYTNGTWRGVFNSAPHQTVVLLVDIKADAVESFVELDSQLQPLRDLDFLTYWNGADRIMRPLTIVVTGVASFDSVLALDETHRDIFFDAPLHMLYSESIDDFDADPPVFKYNISNSYYASTNWWSRDRRPMLRDDATSKEKALKGSDIQQAQARGLISRYWGTTDFPPNLGDSALRYLIDKHVGILNLDDMGLARLRAKGLGRSPLVSQ